MDKKGLLEKVRNDIKENRLLELGAKIIIGVSGGADSVCLLKVLYDLKCDYDLELFVVHVNHGLRGQEANKDESYVMELCKSLGIEAKTYSVNIKALGNKLGISEEEAGREARYKIFRRILENKNFDYIAVAHNREDQAETVMLNILRGTGIDGLCGMSIKQGMIIRPLLYISRNEIEAYLASNKIPYCVDSTNISNEYTRNRIRNILFPQIKSWFDIDITNQLFKLSFLVSHERDYLEEETNKHYNIALVSEAMSGTNYDEIVLSAEHLKTLPIALFKRIIRLAWERINSNRKNLETIHVDQIVSLCQNSHTGKKVHLPNGIKAKISYGRLVLSKRGEKKHKPFFYNIAKQEITKVYEVSGTLESSVISQDEFIKLAVKKNINESSFTQFFNLDSFEGDTQIRSRLEGDRIRPYNANGEKKLKDYFIDQKIPREQRDLIPLVAQGNKIIWIVGMRTSEEFRAREDTKKIWMLSWCFSDNGGEKNA